MMKYLTTTRVKKVLITTLCFAVALLLFTATVTAVENNVIKGILEENITISADTQILGIIDGNVTIPSPHTLTLDGIIVGEVTIDAGATFYLNGIVWGAVVNNGGTLVQTGIIGEGPLE